MACHIAKSQSGISVQYGNTSILLDPSRPGECDFTFVSHAHVDHLHRRGKKAKSKILSSSQTARIAKARGYDMADIVEEHDGFDLVDTGHILGSRGLLVGGDDVFYTGDISIRERAFMKPAKLPHAKTLIIESTFGRPEYVFPALSEVTHRTNKIISEMYNLGIPVILMGYSLGKAQLLTKMFGDWDPVYVHDSVAKMNSVYSELGIDLKDAMAHSEAESLGLLSKNRPWIMIAPLMGARTEFVREMKDKYGAVTIGFTGWATGSRYKYMTGLDYVMPMSDHCDYKELVAAVKQCRPEKVYTFHGFAAEFAKSLKEMGYDAEPVERAGTGKNLSLDSFR
ncbi:MAG TPA: MBL fold metallo-hydrolase [Nitrososphaera sp.]|nr:MBL fold metallo-hydrolase [Nitrososphaera sp.]